MTAEIIKFPGAWFGRVEPDVVLEGSKGAFKDVVVIGEREDGSLNVRSSDPSFAEILWLLKQAELHVLGVPEPDHGFVPDSAA